MRVLFPQTEENSFEAGTVTYISLGLPSSPPTSNPLSCFVLQEQTAGVPRHTCHLLARGFALVTPCLECSSQFSALELLLIPQDLIEKVPLTGSPPEPWAGYTTCPLSLGAQTTQTHLVGACPLLVLSSSRPGGVRHSALCPQSLASMPVRCRSLKREGALPCDLLVVSHRRPCLGRPVIATLRPRGWP